MKNDRRKAILDIVTHYEVDTQETLQALLLERGFSVTQATVSRDIRQMNLRKESIEGGGYKYCLPLPEAESRSDSSAFSRYFSDSVYKIDHALNTVVIKCHSGAAPGVCARLDSAGYREIVGTLAGDDTIFILMRSESDAEEMQNSLEKLL